MRMSSISRPIGVKGDWGHYCPWFTVVRMFLMSALRMHQKFDKDMI